MKALKQSFEIDDTYTKLYRRPTRSDDMTKVKDQIPLVEGYNEMIDILHLPTDKFGFNKLLVICDIARDDFDIEKMKGETAEETLSAFKKMQKRNIIKIPYASILTDGGSSFKGSFQKYLYENGVNYRVARVGRHHQLSNVDSLCRQLGDIFNGIMNIKEAETGKRSKAWIHAIDEVREKLNKYRISRGVKLPKDITTHEYPIFDNNIPKIKFKLLIGPYKTTRTKNKSRNIIIPDIETLTGYIKEEIKIIEPVITEQETQQEPHPEPQPPETETPETETPEPQQPTANIKNTKR